MNRKFKQYRSANPPISTNQIITSNLRLLSTMKPPHMLIEILILIWNRHTK